jgi:hypothetical protein
MLEWEGEGESEQLKEKKNKIMRFVAYGKIDKNQ